MSRTHTSDVLVVGGGIIGLVTAWRAALRGFATAVVDPEPGGGAAQVAAGMLAAVTELHYGEQTLLGLNVESARRYPAFVAELTEATGLGLGYRRCGTLAVALDADDRAHLRELHALQRRSGLDPEWLSGRDCRRLEPMLAPGVRGGLRADGDHQIDPRRLSRALVAACGRAGVVFHRTRAEELMVDRERATGVRTREDDRLSAGRVVLAAGSLSGRLAGVPDDVVPPVRPVKGQVLRLTVPGPYAPFLSRTVRAVVRGSHVYLVPRENGELVVGATSEEQGWDTTVTAGGVYELLRDAHELVPGITELPLTETRAGLRPASPDNAPLLGPTGLDGLILATGHHRNGVLLTPVTGDVLAHVLTTGELPEEARDFTPLRFRSGAARRLMEQPV
ncbi:glycine oxidase ThiO [Streptomyces sp. LBUM 1478]|uniref:glycine oxidase ThiO n=1 Tax=Streptomyces scabiei TaxID=1930 RepID=UPI0007660A01|nr:glycine oxidase ThiO [Streptomyces scabiei]MBP5905458.1 glycine oxidase ThiO [Streptomyces sp. LBUM 1478]MBP5932160.1 glycine oxidase ThiO [Streptomyces sp. LBUM 1479]MDX2538705.1 glycine oxidase ThiO [Streptomyces scabiei]MDX2799979.1 glycine oxidase ThiO [Streptomyces scabiei]MDX2860093.1 glycine oxidase ThiO [Streptomyces scabiei]